MKPEQLIEKLVPVLYEDDSFLAISKPAGVDAGRPGEGTVGGLAEILASLRGRQAPFCPINRLGRYESGILLLAKHETTVQAVRAALKSHRVMQQFEVVVRGGPKRQVITIDPSHGTSQGRRVADSKGPFRKAARKKKSGEKRGPPLAGRGRTIVRLVRRGDRLSLVQCRTSVSTTHALRAQLRAVKMQPLGDRVPRPGKRKPNPEATCLHLTEMRFHHPGKKARITVRSKPPASFSSMVMGRTDITRRLTAALTRRLSFLDTGDTNAYRLLTGDCEDVKGLTAERFGNVVVLQTSGDRENMADYLQPAATWYVKTLGVQSVYLKQFARNRAALGETQARHHFSSRPLAGWESPPEIKVIERGLTFVVRPYDGFSVGLYPDQRDNRTRIRKLAHGKDVLNLFAYTCSFSVAAAAGGAKSTVSVDLSNKLLDWGRKNFSANYLPFDGHEFIAADATDFLKHANRENRSFDVAIVDPPSFAHGRKRGRSFSLVRDLPELLKGVVSLLRADGRLMLSTNHRRTKVSDLREFIKKGAGRRHFRIQETPRLPADYAIDPDHSKTVIVQFE